MDVQLSIKYFKLNALCLITFSAIISLLLSSLCNLFIWAGTVMLVYKDYNFISIL